MPKLMLIPIAAFPGRSASFSMCDLPQGPTIRERFLENVRFFPQGFVDMLDWYPPVANQPRVIDTEAFPTPLTRGSKFHITLNFTCVVQDGMAIAVVKPI
jgi:hypothetical protein